MNYLTKRSVIHPEDRSDLAYWTKKWGVNAREINNAILETGSIRLQDIKSFLVRKGSLGILAFWIDKYFRGPMALR